MKKYSLLAGSLSVLGLVAGIGPAQAATEALTPEVQGTEIQPQVQAEVPATSALLAVQPVAAETPFTATAPTLAAPNTINLADASQTVTSVDQLMNPGQTQEQVTSVSQLSDVKPTDWAYQAVQSLVERYGCIVGYPNSTFRGNRAATRYELAAALNACLDVISDRFATKEDLATLRRLQEEFAKELATLKGRVNGLEARTAKLEAQQFSTTTKLQGTAIMSVQAGSLGNSNTRDVGGPGQPFPLPGQNARDVNPTVISAVLLSLNTTFNGTDLLQTTLGMGNNGRDTISEGLIGQTSFRNDRTPLGNPGPYFNASTYYWNEFQTNVFLYRLAYTFKPFKNVTITAGPQFYAADIIDTNSWANAPASDFGNYFFINNAFIIPYALNYAGGAGGAVQWNPGGGPFTVRALYMASNAATPVRGANLDGAVNGFAGDPYQGSVELEYKNTFGGGKNNFAVRLQGTRALVNSLETTAVGVNAEATFGRLGVFGRMGYAWLNPDNAAGNALGFNADPLPFSEFLPQDNNYKAISFMAGIGYKDLFVPGSMVAVAAGAPFITQGRGSAPGINDRNQVNVEAFYRFPVNDNISISPIFTVIFNPNNSSFNDTIYQGVLRTTFTF